MGIYGEIFKRLKGKVQANKAKRKSKPKKPKTLKMKKRTPEQKAKLRGKLKKVTDRIISGDLEKGAIVATRYAQGKPIVLQKKVSSEDKKKIPKEIIIFGIPIPTAYVVVGSVLILGGTAYAINKARK